MLQFFGQAFQQSLARGADYQGLALSPLVVNGQNANALLMNLNESFARTALASARAGQPFNLLMGTHQFLMTPPLMAFYAALDNVGSTDAGVYVDTLTQDPNFAFSVTGVGAPIAASASGDPQSPNFMVWYNPNMLLGAPGAPNDANCNITDPLIFNANNTSATTHGGL